MRLSIPRDRSRSIISRFEGLHVGVLGDLMLDRYIRGSARRLSPEAPVPVVDINEESDHPGGAANVAVNLRALGVAVSVVGRVGDDVGGARLRDLLAAEGIDGKGLTTLAAVPTTVKTRVIADGQHLVRADRESIQPADQQSEARIIDALEQTLPSLDALILQDYNKGTLTPRVITTAIGTARAAGVPIFVDPKLENFREYRSVTLFKPNRQELENATGTAIDSIDHAVEVATGARAELGAKSLVLTLGAEGMIIVREVGEPFHVQTRAIQVADVSGAGDTVIALLAAAGAADATLLEAAILANAGAGIVCGRSGTVSVTSDELLRIVADLEGEEPHSIPAIGATQ